MPATVQADRCRCFLPLYEGKARRRRDQPDLQPQSVRSTGLQVEAQSRTFSHQPAHGNRSGQRYESAQQFRSTPILHIDQPYWASTTHGGQRTWTHMIFTNEPTKGGATGSSCSA